MPGFNPEQINIHDLTVEEPEQPADLHFDFQKDVTAEQWEKIIHDAEVFEDNLAQWHSFLISQVMLKMGDPEYDLKLTEKHWNRMKKDLGSEKSSEDLCGILAWAKLVDAQKTREMHALHDSDLESLRDAIKLDARNIGSSASEYVKNQYFLKILNPKESIHLSNKEIEAVQEWTNKFMNKGYWHVYARYNAQMRVIDSNFKVNISEENWSHMKDDIKENPSLEFPAWLRILAADEVKATDNGLEINTRKLVLEKNDNIDLPEQRKF